MTATLDAPALSQKMFKGMIGEPQTIDRKARTMRVVMTTRDPDRVGDSVIPKGLDFSNYMNDPVVLWAHNMDKPPIGHVIPESIQVLEDSVEAVVKFANTPFAKEIFTLYADGDLRAWSIGFLPNKTSYVDTDEEELRQAREDGRRMRSFSTVIEEAEVLELSACPVPKNPKTLTKKIDAIEDEVVRKALSAYMDVLNGEKKSYRLGDDGSVWSEDELQENTTISDKAFSKSIAERVANGKVSTEIVKVKDVKDVGSFIEFEIIQQDEIEGKTLVKEARIERIVVKVLENATPEDEGREDGGDESATPNDQGRTDVNADEPAPEPDGRAGEDEGNDADDEPLSEAKMWAEDEELDAAILRIKAKLMEV